MAAACRARLTEPLRDGLFREVGAARVRGADAAAVREWLAGCTPTDRAAALTICDAQVVRAVWMLNSSLSLAYTGKACDPRHTVLLELTDIEISTSSASMSIKPASAADAETLLAQLDECLSGGFLHRAAILNDSEYSRLLTKRLSPKRIKTWSSMQDAVGAVFEQACLQAFHRAQSATVSHDLEENIRLFEEADGKDDLSASKTRAAAKRRRRRMRAKATACGIVGSDQSPDQSQEEATTVTSHDTAEAAGAAMTAMSEPSSGSSCSMSQADADAMDAVDRSPHARADFSSVSSLPAPAQTISTATEPLHGGWTLASKSSHRRRRKGAVMSRGTAKYQAKPPLSKPTHVPDHRRSSKPLQTTVQHMQQLHQKQPDAATSTTTTLPSRAQTTEPVNHRQKPSSRRAQSAHRLLAHLHRAGCVTGSRRKVSFDMRPLSSKHKKRASDESEAHKRDAAGYSSDSGIKRAGNKAAIDNTAKGMPLLAQLPGAAESWPVVSANQWTTASTSMATSTAADATTATARSRVAITGTAEQTGTDHMNAASAPSTPPSSAAVATATNHPIDSARASQMTTRPHAPPQPRSSMRPHTPMEATVPLWSVSAQQYAHSQAYHHSAATTQAHQFQHQAWFPGYANQWAMMTPSAGAATSQMQIPQYFQHQYAMPDNLHGHYYNALADAASPADHVARDVRGVLAGLVTGQAAPIGAGAVAGRLDGDDVVVSLPAASHLA